MSKTNKNLYITAYLYDKTMSLSTGTEKYEDVCIFIDLFSEELKKEIKLEYDKDILTKAG